MAGPTSLKCHKCGHANEVNILFCCRCAEPIRFGDDLPTLVNPSDAPTFQRAEGSGNRYSIVELLGRGGMGAVYKAWDRERDSFIAIKVINPRMAESDENLKRFRQELRLASQITHENVVRIFDKDESGAQFITMEYIDGKDLKKLMYERGKLAAAEAIEIVDQVCRALGAAHSKGVVHRDLKPQNIMMQPNGRVVVTDFGIAHSENEETITTTGETIGTPDYMSPEQAKGKKVDQRSDFFSLGLVFYELVTGKLPFQAETKLATMYKRTQERAIPPAEVERTVPAGVNRVILRCLEPEPESRYENAQQLLVDLAAIDPARLVTTRARLQHRFFQIAKQWKAAVALSVALAMISALVIYNFRRPSNPAPEKIVQVLIADFSVEPGILDTPLEPVLTLALEGASFVDVTNRQRAKDIAADIKAKQTPLDEDTARLVAVREGIDVVVTGSLVQRAGKLQVSTKTVDASTGRVLANDLANVNDKSGVLSALAKLGASIRSSLGDATAENIQLGAAETFTAGSLEAMTNYAKAQEFRSAGKWEQALQSYSRAVDVDPKLGRAYAGMAAASFNLGRTDEAEKYYQLALANTDRMTDREKYRTRGGYFLTVRDYDKAIEEYQALIDHFPADSAGRNNLGLAYFYKRDMSRAVAEAQKFVALYPNNVPGRNNLALYAMYAGEFDTAKTQAAQALKLAPSFVKNHVVTALATLALGRPEDAAKTYEGMAPMSSFGASLSGIGLADLRIFEGRFKEAEEILNKGIAGDLGNKQALSAANKLVTLASVQMSRNEQAAALASVEKALGLSKNLSVVFPAARILIDAGRLPQAASLADELKRRLQREPQAHAKLLEGELLLASGKTQDAIRKFEEARQLADTWLGRVDLGRAYLDAGAFPEASSEFDAAFKRRGEATSVFLDDVPSYHYFAPVLYYLGRVQEGLKSSSAAERYRAFLDIKTKSEADPLIDDARRRLQTVLQKP